MRINQEGSPHMDSLLSSDVDIATNNFATPVDEARSSLASSSEK